MKIVVLDGHTLNPGDLSWAEFERYGEVRVYERTSLTDVAETIERIGDAEIVYTNKTPITKNVIDACPNVRFIGVLATGYNVVDCEYAKGKKIPVANVPSYGTDSVGQFAIAMLLEICHNIGRHDKAVHDGRWENCVDWCFWDYPLIELAGKTMGIIGLGRIGMKTGCLAKAFGMRVLAYDRIENESGRSEAEYVSLDYLLGNSDVISLHCPLLPDTEGIINKDNIRKMKDGVIILNNSRGPLIVEQDLADALNSGKVFAAAVDVVSKEPIAGDNPLLSARNCIITPHISWAPKESRQRLLDCAVDNLRAYISENPINIVNA